MSADHPGPADVTRERLAEQLREADRGEAAGWLAWSQGPSWFPFALGAWAACFVLALGYLDDRPRALVMLTLTASSLAYVAWQTRRQGVWPGWAGPQGFARSTTLFVAGLALVVAVGLVAALLVPAWVVALLVAVATTGWSWTYGSAYAADAERVRQRLGRRPT